VQHFIFNMLLFRLFSIVLREYC